MPAPNAEPTISILFNDRTAPSQVVDIIGRQHSFVEYEALETEDEQGSRAYLLLVFCETATANELMELIGNRLPDYVQARRFPPSRLSKVRAAAPTTPPPVVR